MKFGTLLLLALLMELQVNAQTDTGSKKPPVYKVNVKYEMPAAITGLVLFGSVANPAVVKNASISEEDLKKLSPRNVNSFDRSVITHDAKGYAHAISRSDFLLNASILSPALLALDGNIQKRLAGYTQHVYVDACGKQYSIRGYCWFGATGKTTRL